MSKSLVFAPHPDDDVIGCGGSIKKLTARGNVVEVVYLTSGDGSSLTQPKQELAAVREQEAKSAADLLGVARTVFLHLADGYVTYTDENLIRIINLIRASKPDTIYLPHQHDAHRDHKVAHELCLEAISRAGIPCYQDTMGEPWKVGTILGYEVWTPLARFQYCEDISTEIAAKLQAIKLHKSQLQSVAYDEVVSGLNRYRGATTGTGTYVECFEVLRTASV